MAAETKSLSRVTKRFALPVAAALSFLLLTGVDAHAHDPGLSAAEIRVKDSSIAVRLELSLPDVEPLVKVDSNKDGQISGDELQSAAPQLENLARVSFAIALDEKTVECSNVSVALAGSRGVSLTAEFVKTPASEVNVASLLFRRLPHGHRQYISVLSSSGEILAESLLDQSSPSLRVRLEGTAVSGLREFGSFFALGVEHILTGYDHLAFLIGLLVIGVAFKDAARIITAFTVAHSVTLALAALDVVRISSNLVEPMIAASIVYVGVDNLMRVKSAASTVRWRWLIAFGFGLIHGFGFASAVKQLGIGSWSGGVLVPLLSFNLGVEAGQIAIAGLVLPVIWQLRERPQLFKRFAPVCSTLIALAGGYWFIERLLAA